MILVDESRACRRIGQRHNQPAVYVKKQGAVYMETLSASLANFRFAGLASGIQKTHYAGS